MNIKDLQFSSTNDSKRVEINYNYSKRWHLLLTLFLISIESFLLIKSNFIFSVFSDQSLVGVVLLVQILITYPIKTTITKKGNKLIVDKVSAFFVKSKHEFNFKETSLIIKNLSGPFFSNSYGVGIKSNKDSVSLYDGFLSRGEEGAVFGLFSKEIINKIASFLGLKIKEVD